RMCADLPATTSDTAAISRSTSHTPHVRPRPNHSRRVVPVTPGACDVSHRGDASRMERSRRLADGHHEMSDLVAAKLPRNSKQIAPGRIRRFESDMPGQTVRLITLLRALDCAAFLGARDREAIRAGDVEKG